MKKLLEVILYDNFEIRFKTDIDVRKDAELFSMLPMAVAFTMTTELWGGNEMSVLAVIRMLSMADIAVSVNRDEMLKQLKQSADSVAEQFNEMMSMMEKSGVGIQRFGPEIKPSHKAS